VLPVLVGAGLLGVVGVGSGFGVHSSFSTWHFSRFVLSAWMISVDFNYIAVDFSLTSSITVYHFLSVSSSFFYKLPVIVFEILSSLVALLFLEPRSSLMLSFSYSHTYSLCSESALRISISSKNVSLTVTRVLSNLTTYFWSSTLVSSAMLRLPCTFSLYAWHVSNISSWFFSCLASSRFDWTWRS